MTTSETNHFFIALQVRIRDAKKFDEYLKGAMPTLPRYGGKVLMAYQTTEQVSMEFGDPWHFVFIMQWPTRESFFEWTNSPEYAPWKDLRKRTSEVNIVFCKPWVV